MLDFISFWEVSLAVCGDFWEKDLRGFSPVWWMNYYAVLRSTCEFLAVSMPGSTSINMAA